ncbi:MAG: sel1 repeat family protein [Rhodocyclaceae bacterium]|nr:sel1 repeat family protein [Rhodocyclaceae bacterium]
MIKRFFLILFCAGVLTPLGICGTIEEARRAIERGEGQKALRLLQPLAESHDAEAWYWLGRLYFYDVPGVARDWRQAAHWFRLAAEAGHAEAQYKLGGMYFAGRGVRQSTRRAAHWWREAALQQHAEALNNLGALLVTGRGVERDAALGLALQILAARRGSEAAQENLKNKTITRADDELARSLENNPTLLGRVLGSLRWREEKMPR